MPCIHLVQLYNKRAILYDCRRGSQALLVDHYFANIRSTNICFGSAAVFTNFCSTLYNNFLLLNFGIRKIMSYITVLPHMRILVHTRMGRPIQVYSYGTPIRVWDNILSHISMSYSQLASRAAAYFILHFTCRFIQLQLLFGLLLLLLLYCYCYYYCCCYCSIIPCIYVRIWDTSIQSIQLLVQDYPIRVQLLTQQLLLPSS